MTHRLLPGTVTVHEVAADRARGVLSVIHAGFSLEPPGSAGSAGHGGLLALAGDRPVGALLFESHEHLLGIRRVAVHPEAQGLGVAGALVGSAERVAQERGCDGVMIAGGAELAATIELWEHLGYAEVDRTGVETTLAKLLPVSRVAESADEARALGARLATVLRAGDLVILAGDLGAGKTTFTQGVGAGLRVRGDITSPTFVISRVHPSLVGGPALVHVDAYRIGGIAELDDLDLDTSLDDAVTVVEWGEGVAEGLAETRLEVTITRARGDDRLDGGADTRHLRFVPVGGRWIGSHLREALA